LRANDDAMSEHARRDVLDVIRQDEITATHRSKCAGGAKQRQRCARARAELRRRMVSRRARQRDDVAADTVIAAHTR